MRLYLIIAAVCLAGGPASASSIQPIASSGPVKSVSIIAKSCADCPAVKAPAVRKSYVVPVLPPGTQTTEIREINGERKLVRTEAWLGGSPVVFISKAPPKELDTAAAPANVEKSEMHPPLADGVDALTTTAAVAGPIKAKAVAASVTGEAEAASAQPLDASGFELRLP